MAADFYRRAFEADPSLAAMFTTDPAVQRARFAAELAEIVRSIRTLDQFEPAVRALGVRHRCYGVRVGHYRIMGAALLDALRGRARRGLDRRGRRRRGRWPTTSPRRR